MNIWKSEAGHDQVTFIRCLSNLLPCTKCLLSIWKGCDREQAFRYELQVSYLIRQALMTDVSNKFNQVVCQNH